METIFYIILKIISYIYIAQKINLIDCFDVSWTYIYIYICVCVCVDLGLISIVEA